MLISALRAGEEGEREKKRDPHIRFSCAPAGFYGHVKGLVKRRMNRDALSAGGSFFLVDSD